MTAAAEIGGRQLTSEDIRMRELGRARHALAYLKDKLGHDAIRQLLEPDTAAMTAQVRGWADASDGRWRSASVDLTVQGPSAAGFYAWYTAAIQRDREADLRAGHPEQFINHRVPGMLEVIENIGETGLPWRVFYRSLPDSAPFPQPWDSEFPVRFGAEILDTTNARVGWSMRQLRDTPHGTRFRITSSLPAAAPKNSPAGTCTTWRSSTPTGPASPAANRRPREALPIRRPHQRDRRGTAIHRDGMD